MNALIAKGNAIQPHSSKKQKKPKVGPSKPPQDDHTLNSVAKRTSLPKSFQNLKTLPDGAVPKHKHIANKKLRAELVRNSEHITTSKALLEDADMLLMEDGGKMEVEGEMERTWRVGQSEIQETAGQEAGRGRKEWKLEGGPYRSRYTRNGRHLAIVGKMGHAATFDWQTGALHTELQLQETCRDITYVYSPFLSSRSPSK